VSLSPDTPPPLPHPAPPRDQRPLSRLALASLLLLVFAMLGVLMGFWIALVPALVIGLVALFRIRPERLRGQGMAISAVVISLLFGSCMFISSRAVRGAASHLAQGVLSALAVPPPAPDATGEGGEAARDPLERWLTPTARDAGAAARIRARYAAAVQAVGPYQGELALGSAIFGVATILAPPKDPQEIAAEPDKDWKEPEAAFWVRAVFRDATVIVLLVPEGGNIQGLQQIVAGSADKGPSPVLEDVRFFR
jgi:hypothetical protein